jgi:membrane-associated phospholipid phosphatase
MDAFVQFSHDFANALQSLSPTLDIPMLALSFLGSTEFYLLIIPLVYWNADSRIAIRSLLALIVSEYMVSFTKQLFREPRPYWTGKVAGLSDEPTYGFPSGHSSNSYTFFGYLASRLKLSWLPNFALALIVLIGISRIYLGVHYVHDVLGGWVLGAIILWAFNRYEGRISARLKSRPFRDQILFVAAIAAAMILGGFWMSTAFAGTVEPATWAEFASEAHSPETPVSLAGAFFGGVVGYILMRRYANFSTQGSTSQKVQRYVIGALGVVVIFFGLNLLFAMLTPDETLLGYTLRFIRYGAVAMWVTFDYPWLAAKVGLLTRSPNAAG